MTSLAVQIELEDPLENVGVKLVRLAGAKTNELAGDGCTTSIVLAQGIIAEGMKVNFKKISMTSFSCVKKCEIPLCFFKRSLLHADC